MAKVNKLFDKVRKLSNVSNYWLEKELQSVDLDYNYKL